MIWITAAIFSAVFAGLTSILAKCGIKKTDSDLATALRTVVVLLFSWIMVFVVGSAGTIVDIEGKSLLFLILSGLATGASWICYFKALSIGDVNKVVPIDKSSTVLTVLLAIILFGETSNLVMKLVATLILAMGIFMMVEKKKSEAKQEKRTWMMYAVLAAVFAALTSILAKMGISGVESNLGTAIRTGVVLIMAWLIVLARGKQKQLKRKPAAKPRLPKKKPAAKQKNRLHRRAAKTKKRPNRRQTTMSPTCSTAAAKANGISPERKRQSPPQQSSRKLPEKC